MRRLGHAAWEGVEPPNNVFYFNNGYPHKLHICVSKIMLVS